MQPSSRKNCLICQKIKQIKQNKNRHFVYELKTGYVVIGDNQFYKGYTLFICKKHNTELNQLTHSFALNFLKDMMLVSDAVWDAFKPSKLNYELLGNSEPHLHWHIIPRYKNDPNRTSPIWGQEGNKLDKFKPSADQLKKIKNKLKKELIKKRHE